MRLWPHDRPGRSGTGVFSVGIPTDGIAAGTDGRPRRSDSGFSGDGSRVCHPRGSGDSPRVEARLEDLGRRPGGRSPIKPKAFPASLAFQEPGEAIVLETMDPILNRPRALPQKGRDVIGAHAGTGEKHTV